MADWKLVDVPDSASEYVGQVLEDSGKIAKANQEKEAKRLNGAADAANVVFLSQIAQAAG